MVGWLNLFFVYLVMKANFALSRNVRLAGSRYSNQGRVEVYLNGQWGTVCSSYWSMSEAKIVCRELGLPEATSALRKVVFPSGNTSVLMDLNYCVGTEPSLLDCQHSIALNGYCGSAKEVGVVCGKAKGEAFLVGGLSPNQGRLEVLLNDKYGAVCDNNWSLKEAEVVCKMLGYSKATHVVKNNFFGYFWTVSIVMGNVRCHGNETSLFQCSFKEENDLDCTTVGLVCDRLSVKFQLVGGRSRNEGTIEVAFGQKHMGMRVPWTLFCDSNWTIQDAAVVCRMLGHQDAMFAVGADMFNDGDGKFILLQDLHCHGNEPSVADCKYDALEEHPECKTVGVICGKRNNTIPVRLAGGSSSNSGRVELNLGGHWGTICQNKWSLKDAQVVCRSLGLQEATIATVGSVFGPGNGRIVLDNVECYGNESSLLKCRHDKLGFRKCKMGQEAGVICEQPHVRFQLSGNGSTSNQGVVQVNLNGINGSICSEGWDTKDASVLCRMLGLSHVGYPVNDHVFGPANGVTLLNNVFCRGNETDLMSCEHDVIGSGSSCSHGNDAGVICGRVRVRLASGPTWNHGRVQINIEGVWNRAVWSKNNDIHMSEVICNMIGLPAMGYMIFDPVYITNASNMKFIADIECGLRHTAKTILECQSFKYKHQVAKPKDYQVTCGPPSGNASISSVTANTDYVTGPENAVDDDPSSCFFIRTKEDTLFTVALNKDVYVHSVFVILHNQSSSFRISVQPSQIEDKIIMCESPSEFTTKKGKIYKCSPPTLARHVIIKVDQVNANFGLCNVDVFVFENAVQSQGVLQETCPGLVDTRKVYLMKYNPHFKSSITRYVYTSDEFQTKSRNGGKNGKRLSAFFTIPSSVSQKYKFLVSCDANCELWFKNVAEEGLGKEATSLDYIIKTLFSTEPNVYDKHDDQKSEPVFLSQCHMYYLEGYLQTNGETMHMNVKLQSEKSNVLENLPKDLLFWTLPGKRKLNFELFNTSNGALYADFASTFTFQGNYSFCCQGVFCPTCPIHLTMRFGSVSLVIDSSVSMDCSTRKFSQNILLEIQPDNYAIEIEYFFVGDATKWLRRRSVATLVVAEYVVQECNFLNDLCPGWKVERYESSGSWVHRKGQGMQLESQGYSILKSPPLKRSQLPLKFCLQFAYKMPAHNSSSINISNENLKNTTVWSLTGFHGNSWHQAKVPWVEGNISQVVFLGRKSDDKDHLAIRDVKITAQNCILTPTIANPAHRCSKVQFMCSNGECVPQVSRCNGVRECRDGSDEKGCQCLSNQWQCKSESDKKNPPDCVTVDKLCDGAKDCKTYYNEEWLCQNKENICKEIKCFNGKCSTWSEACRTPGTCSVSSVECQMRKFLSSSKENKKCSKLQGLCAFEFGMCNLAAGNSSQSWTWTRAKDSPLRTILSRDHSTLTSNGSYVYLLQSSHLSITKRMVSELVPASLVLCLQFWYFIHGSSTLKVFVSTNSSDLQVWDFSGNTKGKWVFGQTTVKQSTDYKFVLEGMNRNKNDFIAVDDLSLMATECRSKSYKEYPNCPFDVSMCGWKGHQNWNIKKDPLHGPLLHLEGGSQSERLLTSPLFNPLRDDWKCITFWYYSTLQLFQRSIELVVHREDGMQLYSLWNYTASVKNITYLQIPLPRLDANVKVAFKGKKNQGQPVIAISKVLFFKEECQEIKPIAECHSYQVLDSIERRVTNTVLQSNSDNNLNGHMWYRISGAAGNQIPTYCIQGNHCGSRKPFYSVGSNPSNKHEIAQLKMCITSGQCCQTSGRMFVRHCGDFYVYQEIEVGPKNRQSQVCSLYKEVVPVYDKSKEWDSWTNTNIDNEWETIQYNDTTNDLIETSPEMQEIHMSTNATVEIRTQNSVERHKKFTICFWMSGLNGSLVISLMDNQSSFFSVLMKNNTLSLRIANQKRSVDVVAFDGRWHHVCVTWKSAWGLWFVFQDGHLLGKGMYLGDNLYIPAGFNVRLTNKDTSDTGNKSLVRISNFNVWSDVIPGEEIVRMSYGCNLFKLGTLITWYEISNDFKAEYPGAVHPATCLGISGSARVLQFKENYRKTSSGSFQSPWFNRSSHSNKECLKFKYKIQSSAPISLSVLQTLEYSDIKDRRLWMSDKETGNAWHLGRVLITTTSTYKITIRGAMNGNGYIAVGGLHVTSDKECLTSPDQAKYACIQNFSSSKGFITTPNYPAPYPASTACTWIITVKQDHVIRLNFKAFDLADSKWCSKDSLAIRDGGSPVGKYCGSVYPEILESSSNSLKLSFSAVTDNSYHSGFSIYYHSVKDRRRRECINDCPSECTCVKLNESLVIYGQEDKLTAIPNLLPRDTTSIFFPNNKIFQLKPSDFINLPLLKYVNLERNKILGIENETVSSENKELQTLKLSANFLFEISSRALRGLRNLKNLDLGSNNIEKIQPEAFQDLHNLEILNLQNNRLSSIHPKLLVQNTKLQHLYLQHNKLSHIPNGFFRNQTDLRVLDLSNNQIHNITKESFIGLSSLEELYLDENYIWEYFIDAEEMFRPLLKLRYLKVDSLTLCCYAKKAIGKHLKCDSPKDSLSSCEDMLKIFALRVSIWIMGLLALLGNMGVIIYWNRVAKIDRGERGAKSRVQSYLLTNLAVSDLLMGVYMIIIAVHDTLWKNYFFKHDYRWRMSPLCLLAGALSMISSEASVLILATITADRFNSIVFHVRARPFTMKRARIVCAVIWISSFLMSIAGPFLSRLIPDERESFLLPFYGRSSVCLPLQLSNDKPPGWQYAVSVYIAFNGFAFFFILLAYITIFFKVKTSSKQVRSNMKNDSSLALRVVFIILTDFCCWIPVVIIGILSLLGKLDDPTGHAYAWIAVFVLPVNSSINPFLYTFSNPHFRKLFNSGRKLCTTFLNNAKGQDSTNEDPPQVNNVITKTSGLDNMTPRASKTRNSPLLAKHRHKHKQQNRSETKM